MPTLPGSSIRTGSHSEGSLTAENQAYLLPGEELTDQRQVITIDALPDDVLLPIFDFYLLHPYQSTRAWQSLIHVCRRWRSVVFGSPRRLDLRLLCTESTRSRDRLDIWPALPLIIESCGLDATRHLDNIVAALKCSDRVCHITLRVDGASDLKRCLAAMQQPFPELTYLEIRWKEGFDETVVVPDSFLGGFAPRLESLWLYDLPFPGLPKLLLSATHLVGLYLYDIPHSGYFSPDAMAAALSTLTSLKYFFLRFKSRKSFPDLESRCLPLSTRSVLPVLTSFYFRGVCKYLEDLVTDIDAPQLNRLWITFFNDSPFSTPQIPQLTQFVSRTPMSSAFANARITLDYDIARIDIPDDLLQ